MAKSRFRLSWTTRAVRATRSAVTSSGTWSKATWIVTRQARQVPRRQHHHRAARSRIGRIGGQFGDEFGMARKAEARGVHRRLGDGGRHHARRLAGQGESDRLFDAVRDGRGVGGIWAADLDRGGQGPVDDGQGVDEAVGGVAGRADLGHRHALGAHQAGVADEGEGQRFVSQGCPGGGGDLRPDAGRLAERQDQRCDRSGHLNSIRASLRRSRR